MKKPIMTVAIMIVTTGCSMFGVQYEESPIYQVLKKEENKEIRQYQSYIIAQVSVDGPYEEAQKKAFRILAGYIFGDNETKANIAMTSPVMQSKPSEKISMTAPVTVGGSDDKWTMAFMMPSQYTLEELPSPKDNRISFNKVEKRIVAAITYSWGRGEERNKKMAEQLLLWLNASQQYQAVGDVFSAGYNPPWTLPFLRRNEMMIEVSAKQN